MIKIKIIAALKSAGLALSASHNLTVTDRADLPRDRWTVYVLDHGAEIARVDAALVSLGEPSSIDSARECGCYNSCPPTSSA